MFGKTRGLLVAAVLGILGLAGRAAAQGTLPPPGPPVPVVPPAPDVPMGPGPTITRPVPMVTQPIPVPAVTPLSPTPYYPPPPSSPPPPGPAPQSYGTSPYGCPAEPLYFFAWETQFLLPHVSNHLTNTVTLPDGTTKTISIGGVALDFTAAELFEFGFNLPDHTGQFSVAYRFLDVEGKRSDTIAGDVVDFRSRFIINELSFDYGTSRYEFEPQWWIQARVGARVSWVYYDTTATTPAGGTFDKENDYFVGAGPHVTLDVERKLAMGFGVFGKVDGAVLIGQARQRFEESVQGAFDTITEPERKTLAVPTLQVQVGLSYSPPSLERLRFRAGYQFEEWFNLGNVQGSSLNMTSQGGFFRGEIDF